MSFTMSSSPRKRRAARAAALVTSAVVALILSACAPTGGGGGGGSTDPLGVDDGTELTLWSRAATEVTTQALVDAYNETHENEVTLTIIPTDDFVTKVGGAATGGGLPDMLSADIVFVPNWTSQGLFTDITDRIDGLPFASDIAQSHIDAGTWEGKKYVLPHTMDLSVMMWNKELYTLAGLDPEAGPTTLEEFAEHARAIDAVAPEGSAGTFFGGNCGGCLVFTWWPSIWAAGGDVMNADGTEALLDGPEAKAVLDIYRGLVQDGIILDGAPEETGATWVAPFTEGRVGVMPMPSTLLGTLPEDTGVIAIPGPDGGGSTFVGGDGIGISKDSKKADAAWNFLSWTMSDEAQLEVLAKNGNVVARTDLADNEYSSADPRVLAINQVAGEGVTPLAKNFNAAFNNPGSPWITLFRNYVFGDGNTLEEDNAAVTAELGR
jgi:multiple sugar transport system substrate-binding protein